MVQLALLLFIAQAAPVSLRDAARAALRHPKVTACASATGAAEARRDEARASELPSLTLAAQLNRGTGNVVPGSAFATPGTPASAGPPRGAAFDGGSWTTIVSLGASVEVTELVRRMRDVDAEVASVEGARDREALCVLDAAYEASAAFLDVAGLVAAAKAVDADRARAQALRVRAAALTKASLRPATELAQADAELAGAEGRAATLRRELRLAEARLADAMGVTEIPAIDPNPPRIVVGPDAVDEHPQSRSAAKELTASEWRIASARTGYLPRLEIAAALWTRGSAYPGAAGERLGESGSGLTPDVANWLVGAVVSWDVFDLPQTKARVARAHAEAAGTRARYDAVRLTLANQLGGARASASEAEIVVQRTAPAVEAARMALTQAEARYASGLVDFLDVARVRQLLTESELAHIAAQVALARSHILLARAAGDVGALTQER